MPEVPRDTILAFGQHVLSREIEAIEAARGLLDDSFVHAVEAILKCNGRVGVCGMGKAGLVGNKIQATMASTATPSYRLHPVEAMHGDLGMVCPGDVILFLSRSGQTQELIQLQPILKEMGCTTLLITACPESRLGKLVDVVLNTGDVPEACPLGLAPSSSTAAMLAIGDAVALAVMEQKNVQPEHFARNHPAGALGRSMMKVSEIMRTGSDCPVIHPDDTVKDYYEAVHKAPRRAGAASVVDESGKLVGFFTHGDLFRMIPNVDEPTRVAISTVMTHDPKAALQDTHVNEAIAILRKYRVDELPVIDDAGKLVGLLDIQDLFTMGFSVFDGP